MLIDCSYFATGARHIQNATMGTMPNPNAGEVMRAIDAYIREYQEEFLIRMLGDTLGRKVQEYLTWEGEDVPPTDNAIEELCDRLREPFADYVFFHIIADSNTQAKITGLVRLKCADEYVPPIRRQVNIWNAMVNKNRRFAEWVSGRYGNIVSKDMLTKINIFNI